MIAVADTDIIKGFDYRKGKRNGGREAIKQVGRLMQKIEEEHDFQEYEDCWNELVEELSKAVEKRPDEMQD